MGKEAKNSSNMKQPKKIWNVYEDENSEGEECLYLPYNQESDSFKMFRYGQLRTYTGLTVYLHFLI